MAIFWGMDVVPFYNNNVVNGEDEQSLYDFAFYVVFDSSFTVPLSYTSSTA